VAIFDCDSQGDLSAVFLTDHEKLPYCHAGRPAEHRVTCLSRIAS
jgi:hypothetical protein